MIKKKKKATFEDVGCQQGFKDFEGPSSWREGRLKRWDQRWCTGASRGVAAQALCRGLSRESGALSGVGEFRGNKGAMTPVGTPLPKRKKHDFLP